MGLPRPPPSLFLPAEGRRSQRLWNKFQSGQPFPLFLSLIFSLARLSETGRPSDISFRSAGRVCPLPDAKCVFSVSALFQKMLADAFGTVFTLQARQDSIIEGSFGDSELSMWRYLACKKENFLHYRVAKRNATRKREGN